MPAKASAIVSGLSPGQADRPAATGHVVLLTGNSDEMEARIVGRHKKSDAAVIKKMQDQLRVIFGTKVTVVDTHGRSIADVVKSVARAVLLDEYSPFDVHGRLEEIASGQLSAGKAQAVLSATP